MAQLLLKVQRKRFKIDSHSKAEFVNLCIDVSKTLNYLKRYDKALALLDSAKTLLPFDKQYRIDRAVCIIEAKRDYENGASSMDLMDAIRVCGSNSQKSGELLDIMDKSNTKLGNIDLVITPNPVAQSAVITLCVPDEYLASEIRITDISGKLLVNHWISSNSMEISISKTNFTRGVYLVGLYNNGRVVVAKKMVVNE